MFFPLCMLPLCLSHYHSGVPRSTFVFIFVFIFIFSFLFFCFVFLFFIFSSPEPGPFQGGEVCQERQTPVFSCRYFFFLPDAVMLTASGNNNSQFFFSLKTYKNIHSFIHSYSYFHSQINKINKNIKISVFSLKNHL